MTLAVFSPRPLNKLPTAILDLLEKETLISNQNITLDHTLCVFNNQFAPPNNANAKMDYLDEAKSAFDISNNYSYNLAVMQALARKTKRLFMIIQNKDDLDLPLIKYALFLFDKVYLLLENQPLANTELTKLTSEIKDDYLKSILIRYRKNNKEQAPRIPEIAEPKGPKSSIKAGETKETHVITTPNGATLRPYQVQMVDFVLEKKRAGLFVDMGLGKTLATLATIQELVDRKELDNKKPILIVAPITVALDTWAREAEKWGYDMDVKINIKLPPKKRTALLEALRKPMEKTTLVTTNPAQLKAIYEHYKGYHPFSMIIVDELSMFKSPSAERTKLLADLSKDLRYFIGLTGTPAPNSLLDIYSQMLAIDPQNRRYFGRNYFEYREQFFEPDKKSFTGQVFSWKLKPKAETAIYERVKKSTISMKSEGLIDLPSITFSNQYITLPKKAMTLYEKMDTEYRKELVIAMNQEIKDFEIVTTDGDQSFTTSNVAVLQGKLAQLASGAIYDDKENAGPIYFHNEKLKALKELVETSTSPILLFFYFQSELERLGDYVDYVHLDPGAPNFKEIVSEWNKGNIPLLVAHPASASHGLNLQDGGHTIVWLTTTWSNELYRQAVKRLHRSGQTHPVSVIHLVAKGTVDEEIINRIDTKEMGQDAFMSAIEADIEKGGG